MSESAGLFESLKHLTATVLAVIQTRVELLSDEIAEERLRIGQMLVYACAALFSFGLAIMLFTVFIVVLCWDTHRLQVLGGSCAFFFLAALWAVLMLRRLARQKPKLFAASLAELSKDREQLAARHGQQVDQTG